MALISKKLSEKREGSEGESSDSNSVEGMAKQTPIPGPFPIEWRKGGKRDTNQPHGEQAGGNHLSAEQGSVTLPESGGMRDEG